MNFPRKEKCETEQTFRSIFIPGNSRWLAHAWNHWHWTFSSRIILDRMLLHFEHSVRNFCFDWTCNFVSQRVPFASQLSNIFFAVRWHLHQLGFELRLSDFWYRMLCSCFFGLLLHDFDSYEPLVLDHRCGHFERERFWSKLVVRWIGPSGCPGRHKTYCGGLSGNNFVDERDSAYPEVQFSSRVHIAIDDFLLEHLHFFLKPEWVP